MKPKLLSPSSRKPGCRCCKISPRNKSIALLCSGDFKAAQVAARDRGLDETGRLGVLGEFADVSEQAGATFANRHSDAVDAVAIQEHARARQLGCKIEQLVARKGQRVNFRVLEQSK